ncbi:hypothetical protein F5Y10DRAFT_291036 [Nemania abortiva]|nr:hypothetical protein F5Y10DRAFT_291036 [Nemania abortiva]
MPKRSSNPILKDCVVAVAGFLGDYTWREEKVEQWVTYWGGRYSHTIDGDVTHVLCTEEDFKKKTAPVRAALRNKDTKIVVRDWLEDSIDKKYRLKTLPYDLDDKAKQEEAKKRKIKKMEKCSSNAHDYVDERFWHIYRDSTYFEYQIQLKRNDEESGNIGEKHLLTLWESNAKPYNYRCTTLFTKKSKNKGSRYPLNEAPVDFDTAFRTFKAFFKKRTSIAWDDRIEKMGSTGPECFQYQPPGGGKPVGLVSGHRISVFGNGDGSNNNDNASRTAASDDKIKKRARDDDDLAGKIRMGIIETPRKHGREGDATNADDGEPPVKKSRFLSPAMIHTGYTYVLDGDGDDGNGSTGDEPAHDSENDEYTVDLSGPTPCNSEASDAESDGDGNNSDADDNDSEQEIDDEAASNSPVQVNDDRTAEEIAQMYDDVEQTELANSSDSYHPVFVLKVVDVDANTETGGTLPEEAAEHRSARAAAAAIYDESNRSVLSTGDNQAVLIDAARANRERARTLAERAREREAIEDAEDEDERSDDLV